ncbi:disease resistance protein RFL1-like [Coffea eugenioides]|uniref:disease resistance protein RFL1-like n=1 Tax=Coffea eugenioides TaxID=49369 RepID=UPI000F60E4DE|nr:disease resistance protein RFL1-like [Coffea eugenioides]XP_027156463.1 disease resistance protein RFL1-like [Coffea eugenioides]XP_027171977.1 disease resistance protein RFL1-like [Coffea eugenioides]XP_027172008.1 disease resistance protein RFL1-like [Coffea eugenioides]
MEIGCGIMRIRKMIQVFGKALVEKTAELIVVDYMGRSDMDNMQSLKRKWQELCCKASDVEEEVKGEEMSGKKKRKREVDGWLKDVKKLSPEIDALERRGSSWRLPLKEDPVGKLQLQVEELIQQSHHFNGLVLDTYDKIGEPCLPTKLFGVKFEEALQRIWPCLVTDDISSIGIYGMGGVGKTTLARHIEYHLLEKNKYRVLWVTVSQENFSITSLQDKIANVLGIRLSNRDEEEVRADILRGAFSRMKRLVVLILDDVWEEFCLDRVGIPLHPNKCRLILTTRSLEVCNRIQCQRKFDLQTLDKDEAWDLFKYRLGSETLLQGDLDNIAKSIVEECGGLPLGIITVAGSMRGVSDICEWRNALEQLKTCSIGYDEMERDVFPILEWSFNRLSKCEKNCFLYCCLYPEDRKIQREELIDLFIWAELMSKRGSTSKAFDQGQTILNKLIRVCLLEETRDSEGDDCVKMHDLVRDMALRITHGNSKPESSRDDVPRFLVKSLGQEHSIVALEQEEWTEDLRAVSFYSQTLKGTKIPPAWSPNCPKLSTLLLSRVSIKEIPDSFFRHMCGLKVLNLSQCYNITELPNFVSDLVNLTALILEGCGGLRFVPPLGKLKQLRDLDLSRTEIEDLPEGWESLVNLESLNLRECWAVRRKIIPKGTFSQLHRLQWLLLPYGRVQVMDLEVLNQLEVFIGCLPFTDFYIITRWPKYYNVYINNILTEDPFYDGDSDCEDQEKQLYFHQFKLGRGWNYLPDDMKSLTIEDCEGMVIRCLSDAFRNFTNLSHLSKLVIEDLIGIEFLWQLSFASPRDQLEVSSFSPLRDLQVLSLNRLPNLVGLFYGDSEPYLLPASTFSSLKELWISRCHNMKQLFTLQLLQNLQNLEILGVEDCEGLEEIAADGFQLTSSGATATVILPKLKFLNLCWLPQLNNICKAALICNSIYQIEISGCPKAKRLPLFLPTINGLPSLPSTLHKIKGDKEWWESLEWENPCAKNALDPYFTTQ